jgi:gliding motility-associated-like protein
MQTELACPLTAGETYNVSFRVSCTETSRWAIDGIGLLFTDDPINQSGDNIINPGSPGHIYNPPGSVITQQSGWRQIAGQYTAAGGERYITIGNFIPEDQLTISPFPGTSTFYTSFYVDMVSVAPVTPLILLGNDTTVCYGQGVLLEAPSLCSGTFTWDDGSSDPFRLVVQPGTYSLTAQIGCSVLSDQVTVSWLTEPIITLPPDTVICHGSSILLDPGTFSSYLWQDGSTGPSLDVDQPGTYWVELTDPIGCVYSDTVAIEWLEPPTVNLGDDLVLCLGDSTLLDAGNETDYTTYLWQDNSVERYLMVLQDGNYQVTVSNPCGSDADDINAAFQNCEPVMTVPNAFSPNGDGRNDTFKCYSSNISAYHFQVFDRWGELMFETDDPGTGWDGTKNGNFCPGEIYVWIISYLNDNNGNEVVRGTVLLIR